MKKILHKIKFQTGLIVLFLVIILCSIFGMYFASSYIYQNKITDSVARSRQDVLQQISGKVSLVQQSMVGLTKLYENSIIEYVLDKPKINESDISMMRANLNSIELTYKNAMNVIEVPFHTVVIGDNGLVFVTGHEVEVYDYASIYQKKWFQEIPDDDSIFWTRTHTETDNGEFFISLAKRVYTENGNRGVLLISVSEHSVMEIYEDAISDNNSVYIVDETGKIISEDETAYIGQQYQNFSDVKQLDSEQGYMVIDKNGVRTLLSTYKDPEFGWYYIEENPMVNITISAKDMTSLILVVSITIVIVAMIMVIFLVRMTTRPIMQLSTKMKQVGQGDFSTDFNVEGWQEISYINQEAAKMVNKISDLIVNIKNQEILKRNAEMKTLRMQINPHFMYNTLFSIKCMVSMEENEKAEEMIDAFIRMLREVLDNSGQVIPLQDELEIVEQYLILLKYRFGDSFKVKYEIQSEARKCKVLKMIMQPVVENSIIHGIEPKGGSGEIIIRGYVKQEYCILEVEDDGIGMTDERLEEENMRLRDNNQKISSVGNIGNGNVNQRIVVNYGKEYGLNLKRNERGGITTMIVLPVIYQ